MAAHFLTFLEEVKEMSEKDVFDDRALELFQNTLSFAPLGNTPSLEDWADLHDTKFPSEFVEAALRMLPRYEERWINLGEPKTYEEWQDAVQREDDENES